MRNDPGACVACVSRPAATCGRMSVRARIGSHVQLNRATVKLKDQLRRAFERSHCATLRADQEVTMKRRHAAAGAALALGVILGGAVGDSQSQAPAQGPGVDGSPAWFLQGSFPDPTGRTIVDSAGRVTVPPRGGGNGDASTPSSAPPAFTGAETPPCRRSPLCGNRRGRSRQSLQRVQWQQTMGYTFTYPYVLPPGFGGVPAVALDSKGNLWVFQRADAGKPQLFKFDPNYKLILQVGPDVIGYQDKAHGMAVDAEDNVWITAANSATVMKISPEGKLLMTIGTQRTPGGLGRSQRTAASVAARDDRVRSERRCLHRRGSCEREPQRRRLG